MFKIFVVIVISFILSSCAFFPRIVILKDALSVEEHVQLGVIYLKSGSVSGANLAIKEFEAAIKKDKKNLSALVNLGEVFYKQKKLKKSLQYFESALKYHPEQSLIVNNMAQIHLELADFIQAEELLKKILKGKPEKEYIFLDTLLSVYMKKQAYQKVTSTLKSLELLGDVMDENTKKHVNKVKIKLDDLNFSR